MARTACILTAYNRPKLVQEMASAAQLCLLQHHTTKRRAEQVVEVVNGNA